MHQPRWIMPASKNERGTECPWYVMFNGMSKTIKKSLGGILLPSLHPWSFLSYILQHPTANNGCPSATASDSPLVDSGAAMSWLSFFANCSKHACPWKSISSRKNLFQSAPLPNARRFFSSMSTTSPSFSSSLLIPLFKNAPLTAQIFLLPSSPPSPCCVLSCSPYVFYAVCV